jgi:hypothetical protein
MGGRDGNMQRIIGCLRRQSSRLNQFFRQFQGRRRRFKNRYGLQDREPLVSGLQ